MSTEAAMNLSRLDRAPRHDRTRDRDSVTAAPPRRAAVTALRDYRTRRNAAWPYAQNQLLAALPPADRERLSRVLLPVTLPAKHVICEAGCRPDHAYFPVAGIVALTHELASGATVDVAVTGSEGVVGVALFLGGGIATTRAVVRAASQGYRLGADVLADEFSRSDALRQALLAYAQALFTQTAQTAACRGHHGTVQQVCRFLLSMRDRLRDDELVLTQDTIAEALGVRRETVTVAAGALQADGLIRYGRGRITVVDRGGLERRACECYAVVREESRRLAQLPHAVATGREALADAGTSRCGH
jgi:CRP-like cAMP-binding protein